MTKTVRLRKGLDIKLLGSAVCSLEPAKASYYAVKPPDFRGIQPKLSVKEGDDVLAGSPVFHDKADSRICVVSPVSGKVEAIVRGEKRSLLEVRVKSDDAIRYVDHGISSPQSMSREEVQEKLLLAGLWPMIRQRPYSIVAQPGHFPKSIFISGFSSAPNGPDYGFIVKGKGQALQTGIDALKKLTDGMIHLNLRKDANNEVFEQINGVTLNYFSGPHPAGNVGIQIHHIDPINKGDIVWYIHPQDLVTIGRFFQEGKYLATKTIALTGSEVLKPGYFEVLAGIRVQPLLQRNLTYSGDIRIISGDVLTGKKIDADGFLGFYDHQVSVLPEGNKPIFFGWAMPQLSRFTFYRTDLSCLFPAKKYRLNTNFNGGERAYVVTGAYEKVLPMDILPMQLIKSILYEDIDQMESLGIYEVDEEDFALCEFICPSKTEIQTIIRKGLDLIRKEMN